MLPDVPFIIDQWSSFCVSGIDNYTPTKTSVLLTFVRVDCWQIIYTRLWHRQAKAVTTSESQLVADPHSGH